MGAYTYNPTAASNTSVDGIGAQGSDSPDNIDNLVRALAASQAALVRDLGGASTSVGGTADAVTVSLADPTAATSYFDGMIFAFRVASDSTSTAPTLNVDSIGAKTIKRAIQGVESALIAGDLQAGQTAIVVYRSAWATAAGAFELLNPYHVNSGRTFVNTIELGATSDTTLARDAAGSMTIEGAQVLSTAALTITAANQATARTNISAALKGHIFGLTLSNNVSDATNDIDIAAGECASTETNPVLMVLSSALTKRLDAAWAVGTNQGGLDTGSIANTTYHVWLIQRSDTGVVDALFSTSATSPTMPTNYDRKRRIGSIVRSSAAIRAFTQIGDFFRWTSTATDRNSTSAATDALLTLTLPTGIVVRPVLGFSLFMGSAGNVENLVGPGDAASASIKATQLVLGSEAQVTTIQTDLIYTNTSAQIRFACTISSGSISANALFTHGWLDSRGKDA